MKASRSRPLPSRAAASTGTPGRTLASHDAAAPKPAEVGVAGQRFIDGYLAYLLSQASRRVSGPFHGEVEADGLSVTEWRILASLSGTPHESIGTLSELTLTKQPTLSKIIQRMERQGLVMRSGTTADRRQTLVAMTPEGQALAARYVQRALHHQSQVLQPLGARNARVLIRVLRQLIDLPDVG